MHATKEVVLYYPAMSENLNICCQLRYRPVTRQNSICLRSTRTDDIGMARAPVLVKHPFCFVVSYIQHSRTKQQLLEKHLCNQSRHYEKYGRFLLKEAINQFPLKEARNRSRATARLTLFTISKDEWNTKEDTGKSMKNALYVLRYAKRHL